MRNSFYVFCDFDALEKYLKSPEILDNFKASKSVLFQIFSSQSDLSLLKTISAMIAAEYPEGVLVGSTTVGEIMEGLNISAIVIAVTFFEQSSVQAISMECAPSEEYDVGSRLMTQVNALSSELAGLLIFSTPLSFDFSKMLRAFEEAKPSYPVFGGGTGIFDSTEHSLIFSGEHFYQQGVVALAFIGSALHIQAETYLGWQPLSCEMTITEAEGTLVKTVDGAPAFDVYSRYLNFQKDRNFFKNVLEFPFLLNREGQTLARVPFNADKDGGISFISDIKTGDKFSIGYGDPDTIAQQLGTVCNNLSAFHPDVIFLYVCIFRRYLNRANIDTETQPFNTIAPTVGLYTYGEFCSQDDRMQLQNSSIVAVGIREGNIDSENPKSGRVQPAAKSCLNQPSSTGKSTPVVPKLLHFIRALASDLDRAAKELIKVSGVDKLTQVYNRSKLETLLQAELNRGKRYRSPFSAMLIEVDNFSRISETLGASAGEEVLIKLAALLKKNIRRTDSVGRWDTARFMVILPETNISQACTAAEKLRLLIDSFNFPIPEKPFCSIGLTAFIENDDPESIVLRIEKALIASKANGRNKVEFNMHCD